MVNVSIPSFRPTLHDGLQRLVQRPDQVFAALDSIGGPVSIAFPDRASSSMQQFQAVLKDLSVDGHVYAAHKATSSLAAISALQGVGRIDVASPQELRNAQQAGFDPADIAATGPKTDEFLRMLVRDSILIAIDSYEEMERLQRLLLPDTEQPVLLRLSRSILNMPGVSRVSRFGHDEASLERSLSRLRADSRMKLVGLSYHIDTVSSDEKYYALQRAVGILLGIQADGFDAHVMNIGGGFGTDYAVSRQQLDELTLHLKSSNKNGIAGLTWQQFSYGLVNGQGAIRGIDIPNDTVGAIRLRSLLERRDSDGVSVAQMLSENLIELWVEPGAAIFGDIGVVGAKVIEVKQSDGEVIIVVDAHRNQVCFENNEAPSDPLVLPRDKGHKSGEAYVAGHLCMESDFMSYRKIYFDTMPQAGDILLWTHTGAYRSHFSASQSIGHPLSAQYIYHQEKDTYTLRRQ